MEARAKTLKVWRRAVALSVALLGWGAVAAAQGPSVPDPSPTAPATRDPALEERLRKMEEMNQRLLEQLASLSKQQATKEAMNQRLQEQLTTLSKKYDDLSRRIDGPGGVGSPGDPVVSSGTSDASGSCPAPGPGAADDVPSRITDRTTPGRPADRTPSPFPMSPGIFDNPAGSSPGPGAAGDFGSRITDRTTPGRPAERTPPGVPGEGQVNMIPLLAKYDNDRLGYLMESDDQEFSLRFNSLLQVDSRIYARQNQMSTLSDLNIPRARIYFSGRMTKPIEYQLSFQKSLNSFDLLNAYLNFHYDDRFQVRFGRFRAAYTYEWYKTSIFDLTTPERSLFALNFGPNRMLGLMGWGFLFDQRLEYAVGIFDGARNSYQDFNNSKDVMSFFDYRPFGAGDSPLKFFSVGGSLDAGQENNPLTPAVLRTSTNASSSAINSTTGDNLVSVPFLAFNNDVKERGSRALWELHATYFYKGLSLLGAWDSGHNDFAQTTPNAQPVHLPVGGYFVTAAYLLTGETRERLGFIAPLHPFELRKGRYGAGAFELSARYSELSVGKQVFTSGLADPNLWTNRAQLIDVGLNWYLNRNVKIYFDWEHAMFAQPVLAMPGRMQLTNDLFWLRMQFYF
jgi:phosphate-selective porin OprO and OprP